MSSQERQPTRVGLTIGSTTRLNEFDFAKISLSLERDLVPAENPIDAYRDIKALLERLVTEFQAGKPAGKAIGESRGVESPNRALAHEIKPLPPGPAASKLATLQERLGSRLQDVEVVEGFDGLCVKPKRYLGDSWAEINEVVRALGGKWQKGSTPKDGSWRIPKSFT
jgi:hypothetical protein